MNDWEKPHIVKDVNGYMYKVRDATPKDFEKAEKETIELYKCTHCGIEIPTTTHGFKIHIGHKHRNEISNIERIEGIQLLKHCYSRTAMLDDGVLYLMAPPEKSVLEDTVVLEEDPSGDINED